MRAEDRWNRCSGWMVWTRTSISGWCPHPDTFSRTKREAHRKLYAGLTDAGLDMYSTLERVGRLTVVRVSVRPEVEP